MLRNAPPITCPSEMYCSEDEVFTLIKTLDTPKASGPDGISIHMLKSIATNVAPSLAKLFNMSIRNSHFPACWKQLVLSCSNS